MEVKLFEIRDSMTCIPAMGIKLTSADDRELFLLHRSGYAKEQITLDATYPYIVLMKLDGIQAEYDPYAWGYGRTMRAAHHYLIDSWDEHTTGDVIDVEFILGERTTPKISEALR